MSAWSCYALPPRSEPSRRRRESEGIKAPLGDLARQESGAGALSSHAAQGAVVSAQRRAAEILRREAGLFCEPGSADHIEMLALAEELEKAERIIAAAGKDDRAQEP